MPPLHLTERVTSRKRGGEGKFEIRKKNREIQIEEKRRSIIRRKLAGESVEKLQIPWQNQQVKSERKSFQNKRLTMMHYDQH